LCFFNYICIQDKEAYSQQSQKSFVMILHYVLFDGSSAYVCDEQDMLSITAKDKDTEVVFKSMNLDKASDFADNYNDSL